MYWAVHDAAIIADDIDWGILDITISRKYFTGKHYEDKIPPITHLTAEEDEYEKIARGMERQFE